MFNLVHYAQADDNAIGEVHDSSPHFQSVTQDLTNEAREQSKIQRDQTESTEDVESTNDESQLLAEQLQHILVAQRVRFMCGKGPEAEAAWEAISSKLGLNKAIDPSMITRLQSQVAVDPFLSGKQQQINDTAEIEARTIEPLVRQVQRGLHTQRSPMDVTMTMVASADDPIVTAQYETEFFPVAGEDDFVQKFLDRLLAWNGQQKNEDSIAEQAKSEIIEGVSPAGEEEVNSPLEQIQQMDPRSQRDQADELLRYVYQTWVAPVLTFETEVNPMEPMAMTENPDGIIKHNLCDHCSKSAECDSQAMVKTAADHFGQHYLLYGPTEKRICPKLRGKGFLGGDVVSEYICRHHCLDGMVIDDNKTVCGEALWRGVVMDKYSREFVDKEGRPVGGYLRKRFAVDQPKPDEENRMRLKPGEIRKDRPAEEGNMESRMQAMRKAEGEKRGYRPALDKSAPFNWARDVDQNNVDASQSVRDGREERAGHDTVQYDNKGKQENQPKLAQVDQTVVTEEAVDVPNVKISRGFNLHRYVEKIAETPCVDCDRELQDAQGKKKT